MPNANTSDVLNKAADLIEETGWGTGFQTWDAAAGKGLCLEGGIAAAAGIDVKGEGRRAFKTCPAYVAVWNHLQDDTRWDVFKSDLYDWNDATGRTAEEVVEVLRAVAVIESAREEQGTPPVLLSRTLFDAKAADADHGLVFDYATINGTQYKAIR